MHPHRAALDYLRAPRREVPRAIDYRAIRQAQLLKAQKNGDSIDVSALLDLERYSTPTVLMVGGGGVTLLLVLAGYFCAPSVDQEEHEGSPPGQKR